MRTLVLSGGHASGALTMDARTASREKRKRLDFVGGYAGYLPHTNTYSPTLAVGVT